MNAEASLQAFIAEERAYFDGLATGIDWESDSWPADDWLFHRGARTGILFHTKPGQSAKHGLTPVPAAGPLPEPYAAFCKAITVHFHRTRGVGLMSVLAYLGECRRLFNFLFMQGKSQPFALTAWHFHQTVEFLQRTGYTGVYDSAVRLSAVADVMDRKGLTPLPLQFQHGLRPRSTRHDYVSLADPERDEKIRKDEQKLPSREALEAYAICTNNPINDDEEILLRTIDLLVAMGQRGNEVACVPYDCWVERPLKNAKGELIIDSNGQRIQEVGIRYYAEKQFQSRVHWLADQDVPLARRAVTRLIVLTDEVRKVARWQEDNPGRLWTLPPEREIHESVLLSKLGFANHRNLYVYLKERNGIAPSTEIREGSRRISRSYRAGQIESILLRQLGDHVVLKENIDGQWRVILRTSDTLSIRFDGAFRFKRAANTFKVLPARTTLKEINSALGANPENESIFERRKLTEADGSRIELTSHQPRHWRNTLYALAGMSNVQQALAMGRQKLDQNPTYQHTSLEERTASHHDFLAFSSAHAKVSFLHDGIRSRQIVGDLTDAYHHLIDTRGIATAEGFLRAHAQAMHITPFGGCTHDFSQAPCPKHLQCWNRCSHLHRTATPGETERLQQLLENSERSLEQMRADGTGEYGSDVWVAELEAKIANLKRAIAIKATGVPVPIFPDGKPITRAARERRNSSVAD